MITDKILAVIGGTGLEQMDGAEIVQRIRVKNTPFGAASSDIVEVSLDGRSILFLSRHGEDHSIPPHKINYRANLWALKEQGVEVVIGVAAVGGISSMVAPGQVVIPDQIVDYTWGREHTFFDGSESAAGAGVEHIDFSWPYCAELRGWLLRAANRAKVDALDVGVYAATQGPRLESVAEIRRLEQDGCDLVGMTGMPEAALAREIGLCYACCAVSANWAAGKSEGEITMEEINENLKEGMARVKALLAAL
ncbi:MAG: S-methyl-5'-thioinosine phosphorylase [Thiotrichales bacterium]|jgi:5'-methylthioinosine phosphorylase|nr:S-methyl-5'-thioinosine phosphorylase [Thiotrichales bacterium]MBT3612921.1 S-methyl-5'-thioinosine phosphorylase [Thiotrichales bacterium]MBT3752406.1 S-methyl-5'-thioinosine phosphorylase [Thiotrichales bacterium]MBT3836910.1 S-methyl-5'-thioinosine phosphorylase [Thiotrichales bacterium]MBT4152479.1 S-methyl-5'-thioinosine phosphorylase [Thiotrichales bacterium]